MYRGFFSGMVLTEKRVYPEYFKEGVQTKKIVAINVTTIMLVILNMWYEGGMWRKFYKDATL